MTLLLAMVGAAVGAPARYLTDRAIQRRRPIDYPVGTLIVNLVASFVLGVLLGLHQRVSADVLALIGTGICGALSTYSTFSYEVLRLYQRGRPAMAAITVAVTIVAGIGVAGAGWAIAATIV
jgi:CrcB protein